VLGLGNRVRFSVMAWLPFDYSNHNRATFALWIHFSYKDTKLPTTPRPMQRKAKAKPGIFVLEVEDSLRGVHLWLNAIALYTIDQYEERLYERTRYSYLKSDSSHGIFLHQWLRAPRWSVAVPTIRRQSVRSLALLQAECRIPLLTDYVNISRPQPVWYNAGP